MKRLNNFIESLDVPIITTLTVSLSFTTIETVMKILALLIGAGYSAWKWYTEWKKHKDGKAKNNRPRKE